MKRGIRNAGIVTGISLALLINSNLAGAKIVTIQEIQSQQEKCQNHDLRIEGTIYHTDYYINEELKENFKAYKIVDNTGTAYVYKHRNDSLALDRVIAKDRPTRGSFEIEIKPEYCNEKDIYVHAILEDWEVKETY